MTTHDDRQPDLSDLRYSPRREAERDVLRGSIRATVIVLGHNGRSFLPRCLSSVLDQTYPSEQYEVIYADNASTDGSADLVEAQFPAVRLVRFPRNLGFAEGNNRAAELAQGRYLLFLNQDTVVHRRWLAEMVGALEAGSATPPGAPGPRAVRAAHAAGCLLHEGPVERDSLPRRGYISEVTPFGAVDPVEIDLPAGPVPTLHLGGAAMILDRRVVADLDYIFDPRFFAYCEDLDLGLRLNGLGYGVVWVPTAIFYHHREGRAEPSRLTLRRTALATRNRFLAYMKNMYAGEFLLALPLLFLGSVAKMRSMAAGRVKWIAYSLALLPFTAYYLSAALVQMPRYAADRRRILRRRSPHHPGYWLLRELWRKRKRIY